MMRDAPSRGHSSFLQWYWKVVSRCTTKWRDGVEARGLFVIQEINRPELELARLREWSDLLPISAAMAAATIMLCSFCVDVFGGGRPHRARRAHSWFTHDSIGTCDNSKQPWMAQQKTWTCVFWRRMESQALGREPGTWISGASTSLISQRSRSLKLSIVQLRTCKLISCPSLCNLNTCANSN